MAYQSKNQSQEGERMNLIRRLLNWVFERQYVKCHECKYCHPAAFTVQNEYECRRYPPYRYGVEHVTSCGFPFISHENRNTFGCYDGCKKEE